MSTAKASTAGISPALASADVVPHFCDICHAQVSARERGRCSRCGRLVCMHHLRPLAVKGSVCSRVCSTCSPAPSLSEQEHAAQSSVPRMSFLALLTVALSVAIAVAGCIGRYQTGGAWPGDILLTLAL